MFFIKTTDNRIVQGDQRILTFILWDMDSEPIVLTGKKVYITVQRHRDSGTILINDKECTLSITPADGTITYNVEAALTSTWEPGHYYGQFTKSDASTGEIEKSNVIDFQILRTL